MPDSGSFVRRAICADLLDLVQHFARALRDLAADFGQQHLARRALDERDAELFLELLDLRRQRRLADEARLGGAAEMLVFGERDQISEVAQVHGRPCYGNRHTL